MSVYRFTITAHHLDGENPFVKDQHVETTTAPYFDNGNVVLELKLEHIALSVSDLEQSIGFYRDLVGMEIVEIIECSPDTGLGDIVGIPGCSARIAKLKSGQTMLELFEYLEPRGRALSSDRTQADNGLTHLGFTSSNIHSDYKRLREHGVQFYSEPIEYRPNVWNAYFYGPDGETCEIRQFTG